MNSKDQGNSDKKFDTWLSDLRNKPSINLSQDDTQLLNALENIDDGIDGLELNDWQWPSGTNELSPAPAELSENLYDIASIRPKRANLKKRRLLIAVSLAASIALMAPLAIKHFQKSPSEQEILQAQHDLATAFSYLNNANHLASQKIQHSLNSNFKKATVEAVFDTVRDKKPTI